MDFATLKTFNIPAVLPSRKKIIVKIGLVLK
jgi:hypothetical protein